MKKTILALISVFLFVSIGKAEIVTISDYDIFPPLGSWLTYGYTYPDGVDDFTVTVTKINSGQFEGKLRRGDYYEYHPSDPETTWMIYEMLDESFIVYESSGTVFDPPFILDKNFKYETELDCFLHCSVYPFSNIQSMPDSYWTKVSGVTVPAGTFNDVIVKFSTPPDDRYPPNSANSLYNLNPTEVPYAVTHIKWYAKGVGLIKSVDINSGTGAVVHQYELKSYNVSGSITEDQKSLFADFSQWGLFLYETPTSSPLLINQSPVCMAPYNGKLAVGFAGLGLYSYNGTDWQLLHSESPLNMTQWNDKLAASFETAGLQLFDGTSWTNLNKVCKDICTWNNKLVVSFDDWGLFLYDGSQWTYLTKAPESMAPWGNKLAVNFDDWGLFTFDGLAWTALSKKAASITTWSGKLVVAFDDWGLFTFDGTNWTPLSKTPKIVTAWNNQLVVGFSDWGLFTFDGTTWSQLSDVCPDNMAASSID